MTLRPVSMDFNYGSSFGERSPSAYETLLLDAMIGDATLYTRQDMVEASWAVVEPILEYRAKHPADFPNYPAGSWGPKAADEMLRADGHVWRAAMNAPPYDPERILKELASSVDETSASRIRTGVLRACAMTLIVVADEAEDSNMHRRDDRAPDRRSIRAARSSSESRQCASRVLEARVFAQCWMPFGERQQICCEQVEIICVAGQPWRRRDGRFAR